MPYQMTNEEANQYAQRMYNDDYWNKEYSLNPNKASTIKHDPDNQSHLEIPMISKISRYYVGDDDSQEYLDRIDAMDRELDQDDQGEISLDFDLIIKSPFAIKGIDFDNADSEEILNHFNINLQNFSQMTMYNGVVILSENALDHLLRRMGVHYMIIDSIDQNREELKAILNSHQ